MSAGRNEDIADLIHDVLAVPVFLGGILIERLQHTEQALRMMARSCPACEAVHWTQIPSRHVRRGDFWWCPSHDPEKPR